MKQLFTSLTIALLLCVTFANAQSISRSGFTTRQTASYWHLIPNEQAPSTSLMPFQPTHYLTYILDETALKLQLFSLSTDPAAAMILSLPMGDGTFRDFKVWQTPVMPDELAARYPDIKTFTGEAVGNHTITAKLDFTPYGFHAMIFGTETSFVDPYDNYHDGYYVVHYRKDEYRPMGARMKCERHTPEGNVTAAQQLESIETGLPQLEHSSHHNELKTQNGWTLRTYRLALCADHFYCQAATGLPTPTIAQCLAKMTTSMNRINGVYNREFSVQMNFCAKEDTLIWPTNTGSINGADPFNTIDANAPSCLTTNQTTCDTRIGATNYDIGHVFTTGGGGLSALGVVCTGGQKAQSVTGSPTPVGDGYDIDYVAHEMGHEFGSNHTFNNNMDGSCGGNAVSSCAYEPGSGATIMDYAGICNPDDIYIHSNAYFSASSLVQITATNPSGHLTSSEEACAVHTATGNHVATLPLFSATYTIPYKTPFELTGPTAVDSVADTANTYGWLQWNLGDFGKRLNQTYRNGPIFRSFQPVYNPTRIFPQIDSVLHWNLSNAGVEAAEGEKAPDTARFLSMRMVVRSMINGYGCFLFPDDSIHINAWQTGAASAYQGFKVTSQGTTGIVYTGGTTQTITWNVVGTSGAPVSAANVDIYMSTDGGYTWPYTIGTFPNNGTASVTIPNPAASSTTCRIKVKGNGNIFFNVNKTNFTVNAVTVTAPITGTFTVCVGATTTLGDATTPGTWSSSNTAIGTVGSASGIVGGISAGTVTITYTASSGSSTAIVTVNGLPAVAAIGGASTVCIGQTTPLTDATTPGTWSSSNTAFATVDAAGIVTGVAAGAATISYTVSNTCGSTVVTVAMTVSAGTPVAAIGGTLSMCLGGNTTLTDATTPGTWSSANTAVATVAGGVVSSVSAGTATISYNVTSGSGCLSSATAIVTVNGLPSASIAPSGTVTICSSGSALLTATAGTGYTYQWQNGAGVIAGATNANYTVIVADNYQVTITSAAGCSATSPVVTVVVGSGLTVVPSVTVTGDMGSIICTSTTSETYTANPVNGGATPSYQWYVNGVATGTGSTYSYIPVNGDVVTCMLTSSASCASPDTASGSMMMTVSAPAAPSVGIIGYPGDTVCTGAGDTIMLAAIPTLGGTAPTYVWNENGINVATGPYYIYHPSDGDSIKVTMTSNAPCITTPIAVSSYYIIHVDAPQVNSLTVSVAQSSIVAGSVDTFFAVATNAGSSPAFQWYVNGLAIPGATSFMYVTDSLAPGQVVLCKETSSYACSTPHTILSGGLSVSVIPSGVRQVAIKANSFTLQPNPNNGAFTINGIVRTPGDDNVAIVVTDVLGQTVYKATAQAVNGIVSEHVSLAGTVAQGTYLVSVTSGGDRVVFHVVIDK